MNTIATWQQLASLAGPEPDKVNGPTNTQSFMRLFGQSEPQVTFYRDLFAWCPYCQKVWLFLEERRIPYSVKKVTMFCYGEKERWYKDIALSIGDNAIITESDDILAALESRFGSVGYSLFDARVTSLRQLERRLFSVWCQELQRASAFQNVAKQVELALELTAGPYFLESFSVADIVFIPYLERMRASLFYYKGYDVCEKHPKIKEWFDALWTRETYVGTVSDFFTHVHDLPPQMGGCYASVGGDGNDQRQMVNRGPWLLIPQMNSAASCLEGDLQTWKKEAIRRCVRHKDAIVAVNSDSDKSRFDTAFRFVLGKLGESFGLPVQGDYFAIPKGYALGLRHLRDQISVPRDMSVGAGSVLRQALEDVAQMESNLQPPALPTRHRRDQNAKPFQ
ncbi:hypothetical protein BDR26DRAFT_864555 [Obelidium mucronatum]|nr:hypothetical protein BDR26DRAFT_864555 [Obelidium mucronatum]